MVFVILRLFDATGGYPCPQQQERLQSNGFKTRNFDRRVDEAEYRWESFWDTTASSLNKSGEKPFKRWTIEITGLNEGFAVNFLDKFGSPRYPKPPVKSADELSYYITIATDPNLARDGEVIPMGVAAFYINKLEETGLKCNYTQYVASDRDHLSPSMIWTLTEWR